MTNSITKPIYIINGPNLNLLGSRETDIYGVTSLQDIEQSCAAKAAELGLNIQFLQSNNEGDIVNWVQAAREKAAALVINAAGYTHTSVAIHDAVKMLDLPIIEVHLSNIYAREEFRHHSYISPLATGVICGLGPMGYLLALESLAAQLGG